MGLPVDASQVYPPPFCATTVAVVAEADMFLAAAGAEGESVDDWEVRRGGWWTGSQLYGGESFFEPYKHWNRRESFASLNEGELPVTIPLARELVSFSAAQVVGSGPNFFVDDAEVQHRLDEIVYETEMVSHLTVAAELASAYGGVYFRVADTDPPRIGVVRPDLAVPVWHLGKLKEVTFETRLPPPEMDVRMFRRDNHLWWRLLERYYVNEDGVGEIEYGLYASQNRNQIGKLKLLADHPATARLAEVVESRGLFGFRRFDLDHFPVHYVPNLKSRFSSGSLDEGRSDISPIVDLLRAVDTVTSSIVEEVQVGKPKVFVPNQFITSVGGEKLFDESLNVLTGLEMDPGMMTEANIIKQVEFKFDHEARIAYTDYLKRLAIQAAGWAAQDFGYDMRGYAESGTALRERKLKSLNTQARKREHFGPALEAALNDVLLLDGVPAEKAKVRVEFEAAVAPSDSEVAEIVELRARSGVFSRYSMIKYAHPEWSEEQIQQELDRDPGGYGAAALMKNKAEEAAVSGSEATGPADNNTVGAPASDSKGRM